MADKIKIDYKTCNLVMTIKDSDDEYTVYVPHIDDKEISSNARVLGVYSTFIEEVGSLVLMTDYESFLDEAILSLSEKQADKDKYITETTIKIRAMLERSISGGYYYDTNYELKPLADLNDYVKNMIRGKLLFFIVMYRYIRPQVPTEIWVERMKSLDIGFTSLTAMDYKNSIMKPQSKKETIEK